MKKDTNSSIPGWDVFWKNQTNAFSEAMKIATIFFAAKIEKLFALGPSHQVLDYGAGPGFLADYFATKNVKITSADINKFYIDQRGADGFPFIQITTDIETNNQIFATAFKEQRFDFIILLSVTQYLKNEAELGAIIDMILLYLKPQGKIVLADVVSPDTTALRDASSLLVHCARVGRLGVFFRFMLYLSFSNYRKQRINVKFLKLTEQSVRCIANRHALHLQRIEGLTVHSSRTNFILTKQN